MSARAAASRRRARRRPGGAPCRVDARRARRHLRRLACGDLGGSVCPERAAKLVGIPSRELQRLLKGRGRKGVRSIPRETERRILAVTPRARPTAPSAPPGPHAHPPAVEEELPWPPAS